jgi:hypothetical protein
MSYELGPWKKPLFIYLFIIIFKGKDGALTLAKLPLWSLLELE